MNGIYMILPDASQFIFAQVLAKFIQWMTDIQVKHSSKGLIWHTCGLFFFCHEEYEPVVLVPQSFCKEDISLLIVLASFLAYSLQNINSKTQI